MVVKCLEESIKFKRKIGWRGTQLVLPIPVELQEFLDIDIKDEVEIVGSTGKHGKFIAFWVKEEGQDGDTDTTKAV